MRTNGEYGAAADAGRTRAQKVVASARALGRLGVPQRILSAATLLTFQLAEVMISSDLFHRILAAIQRLRPSPVPI
jgi:hypothetical protein